MARVPLSVKLAFGKDPSGKSRYFSLISVHNVTVCFSWSAAVLGEVVWPYALAFGHLTV